MKTRERFARIVFAVGGIAALVGAIDPLEGSIVIFIGVGSMSLALGWGEAPRRAQLYQLVAFLLVAFGTAAMVGLTAMGGFGGNSGRSIAWGLLIVPYLIGWILAMSAPDNPRWLHLAAFVPAAWYLVLPLLFIAQGRGRSFEALVPITAIAATGLATVICLALRLARGSGGFMIGGELPETLSPESAHAHPPADSGRSEKSGLPHE